MISAEPVCARPSRSRRRRAAARCRAGSKVERPARWSDDVPLDEDERGVALLARARSRRARGASRTGTRRRGGRPRRSGRRRSDSRASRRKSRACATFEPGRAAPDGPRRAGEQRLGLGDLGPRPLLRGARGRACRRSSRRRRRPEEATMTIAHWRIFWIGMTNQSRSVPAGWPDFRLRINSRNCGTYPSRL